MTIRTRLMLGAATLALAAAAPVAGQAATLIGLTADNHLVHIDSETRKAKAPVMVRGLEGTLIGIDIRPADGKLYGVTTANQIVTIDPMTGRAMQVSRLSEPFVSGGRATVDFNPVADRLRLMGMSGVNFRINVETGAVTKDGTLKYQAGTPWAETAPRIVAGAYTDSVAGTKATTLYTIDTLVGVLNMQAPPNDGVQQSKGRIDAALPAGVAFDILADGKGANWAFLLATGGLHTVALDSGKQTMLGPVTGLPAAEIIDIAAMN